MEAIRQLEVGCCLLFLAVAVIVAGVIACAFLDCACRGSRLLDRKHWMED